MKLKSIIGLFLIVLITVSCSKESCSENVNPPRASILVDVRDEVSGENVFTNLTYTEADIVIVDNNDEDVLFDFITKDDLNYIQIFPETATVTNGIFYLKISDTENIEIQYDVELNSTECYTQKIITNVVTPSYTTTLSNHVYSIKI